VVRKVSAIEIWFEINLNVVSSVFFCRVFIIASANPNSFDDKQP